MTKKVLISSDSTCDLSPELVKKYNISITPLAIHFGDECRYDGVTAVPDDIYKYYEDTGRLPTTAAINPGEYVDYFSKIKTDDCEIVHFCISSQMSSTYANCSIAAQELGDIYPIDSENLSTGIGLLVLYACDLASEGYSAKEIADKVNAMRPKVNTSFIIDKLLYLWKGGRCSGVAALGANVLKLKPCIEVKYGKMEVGKKYRGKYGDVLEEYTLNRIAAFPNVRKNRIFITHTRTDPENIARVRKILEEKTPFEEILETTAGCSVSAHCGPNTLGILFIEE